MSVKLDQWYPVASSTDLPKRHVYHGQLWGRELAIWRADDGFVNAWENRCLHRGVRLSIGLNEGRELRCLYHGWRYANRTAGCTYIPAHPADAPARTICNNTYQCIEANGLVWSAIDPAIDFQNPDLLDGKETLALRPIPVNASPELAQQHAHSLQLDESKSTKLETVTESHLHMRVGDANLLLFIQPQDANQCVLRGVIIDPTEERIALLRHYNQVLSSLRDDIETEAVKSPQPAPIDTSYAKVDEKLAQMPELVQSGSKAEIRVQVARKWQASEGVMAFRLEGVKGQLPTVQPGAHIDVQMPNGISRQYSVTNGPGETDHYTIGVKLEPDSRGGSDCMHNTVREGDLLAISAPRANFPLRRDALKTILVAGGIGITPMLAMAQTLNAQKLPFELHYFAQSQDHLSFPEILDEFADNLFPHRGLSADETGAVLKQVLAEYNDAHHLYICGPGPMLEAARNIAAEQQWPDEAVHFEYFKNTKIIDDSSAFEVALARSAMSFQVPAGKSILEVLQENGIEMPSSCEQGACGTCLATVLEGEPDHQDVYLSDSEKQANDKMMTCVSRAKSKRLVLDI